MNVLFMVILANLMFLLTANKSNNPPKLSIRNKYQKRSFRPTRRPKLYRKDIHRSKATLAKRYKNFRATHKKISHDAKSNDYPDKMNFHVDRNIRKLENRTHHRKHHKHRRKRKAHKRFQTHFEEYFPVGPPEQVLNSNLHGRRLAQNVSFQFPESMLLDNSETWTQTIYPEMTLVSNENYPEESSFMNLPSLNMYDHEQMLHKSWKPHDAIMNHQTLYEYDHDQTLNEALKPGHTYDNLNSKPSHLKVNVISNHQKFHEYDNRQANKVLDDSFTSHLVDSKSDSYKPIADHLKTHLQQTHHTCK